MLHPKAQGQGYTKAFEGVAKNGGQGQRARYLTAPLTPAPVLPAATPGPDTSCHVGRAWGRGGEIYLNSGEVIWCPDYACRLWSQIPISHSLVVTSWASCLVLLGPSFPRLYYLPLQAFVRIK